MKHLLMNLIMLLIVVGLNVNLCNATPLVFDDIEFDLNVTNAGEMDVSIASNALCPSGNESVSQSDAHPPNFHKYKKKNGNVTPVPEPATMLLFGTGLILIVVIMKRKINMSVINLKEK